MTYRIVGEITMTAHFAFLGYLALGGFAAHWRRWAIWPHLLAVGWGLGSVLIGFPCPLTSLENWARRRAGQAGLARGFIDHYLEGVVYPARYTALLQAAIALIVVASWLSVYLRWRTRR